MYICDSCIHDSELQKTIKLNRVDEGCSFCEQRPPLVITAPLECVLDHIEEVVVEDYDDAEKNLPYDKNDGYLGDTWDTTELLQEEFSLDVSNCGDADRLLKCIVDWLGYRVWSRRDPYSLTPTQESRYSWDSFSELVKHKQRFFFEHINASINGSHIHYDGMQAREILDRIWDYATGLELFRTVGPGDRIFRARYNSVNSPYQSPDDLGPPPADISTTQNRMSPAGIPMFYASDDPETALAEIQSTQGVYSVGEFEFLREAVLLDLAGLPPDYGPFWRISDAVEFDPRWPLRFLHHVAVRIAEPIIGSNRVNIDYIPTQVMTEYVRYRGISDEQQVDGIAWNSSVKPGGVSYVFFLGPELIKGTRVATRMETPSDKLLLKLSRATLHTLRLSSTNSVELKVISHE
jgi:hypothetical protein